MQYDHGMVYEYKSEPFNTGVVHDTLDEWLNNEIVGGWRLHSILQETDDTFPVFIFERVVEKLKKRTEDKNRWISVKDGLPPEPGVYWVLGDYQMQKGDLHSAFWTWNKWDDYFDITYWRYPDYPEEMK